jgi:hypothetical protein
MSRRTEHKLRNQRAGSGAGHQCRGARSQISDQQAGERANPGADNGDHEPLGHCSKNTASRYFPAGCAGVSESPMMYTFSSGCRSLRRLRISSSWAAELFFRRLM